MTAPAQAALGPSAPGRRLRSAGDDRLVAGLRSGDERCFEVIYDRYHQPLLAFCRHMLGTREEAEDALQHVFVAAHRQLHADAREVQLRPWLYAIARNRCLSVLRARRHTVALEDIPEAGGDGLAVAAEVEQRQDLKDMLADLARLPEDQRAALVLAELDDLSHDEIAVALDVRREKVKALVFQARESLLGYRQAREADCGPVREQLATLRGSALRRAPLQRHVAVCPGCAQFKAEVTRQRATLAAVLPVVPALGLKDQILAAVHTASPAAGGAAVAGSAAAGLGAAGGVGAGGAAVSGGTGIAAAISSSGLVAKALVVAAVAASAGGGAVVVAGSGGDAPHHARAVSGAPAGTPAGATTVTRRPGAATLLPVAAGGTKPSGAPGRTPPGVARRPVTPPGRQPGHGRATAPGQALAPGQHAPHGQGSAHGTSPGATSTTGHGAAAKAPHAKAHAPAAHAKRPRRSATVPAKPRVPSTTAGHTSSATTSGTSGGSLNPAHPAKSVAHPATGRTAPRTGSTAPAPTPDAAATPAVPLTR